MGVYPYGTPITITETFYVLGNPTDPTDVIFTVQDPYGVDTTYTLGLDANVTNPDVGVYVLDLPAPAYPGTYHYQVVGSGAVEATSPPGEFTVMQSVTDPQPVTWAVQGPCTPWCDAQAVFTKCGSPTETVGEGSMLQEVPVDMSPYAEMASWLLYLLTARLFAGICEKTVRPCGSVPCGFQTLPGGYTIWPTYDGFPGVGWGWNGMNWNWPDFDGCSCKPIDKVYLSGYPVREILEVKIDGVVLPEFSGGVRNWRLDKRRFLVRMAAADGSTQRWPACQRRDMDDTEVGTFAVTYLFGQEVPLFGQMAAAQLACELYKDTTGADECALPAGTSRLVRQGITIEKLPSLGWKWTRKLGWQTGLGAVDAFLNGANPNGHTRRPMMMAPGQRRGRFAQPVGQE